MNKKVKEFLDNSSNYEVVEYIGNLQQGIKHLDEVNCKLRRKIGQLEDNWNKLKEYLHNQIPTDKTVITKYIKIFEVLNKMQELEGSDNDE